MFFNILQNKEAAPILTQPRRLRRMARLMQLTDYRAFCKTPLLAAVGSRPPTQGKQKTEIFVQASAIEPAHIAERSRKYAKSKAFLPYFLQQIV
ncbi:MAG: hypothetical protein MSH66_08340 [Bacteroidales bacterium]|nr:hypothetical protein [Bacteroidales bacterium]